jgi:hypothetical protein
MIISISLERSEETVSSVDIVNHCSICLQRLRLDRTSSLLFIAALLHRQIESIRGCSGFKFKHTHAPINV